MIPSYKNDWDGHIILYCKNHYISTSHNVIEDLKMLWAIRCGYEYRKEDNGAIRTIIDRLYKILLPFIRSHEHFQQQLHDRISSRMYDNTPAVERIIRFYISEIAHLQVREKVDGKDVWLIELPEPKKQVINRILRGNGRYSDYREVLK